MGAQVVTAGWLCRERASSTLGCVQAHAWVTAASGLKHVGDGGAADKGPQSRSSSTEQWPAGHPAGRRLGFKVRDGPIPAAPLGMELQLCPARGNPEPQGPGASPCATPGPRVPRNANLEARANAGRGASQQGFRV
jgi:hypothetical protein